MPDTFNRAELLERVDHDMDFLAETVEMLVTDGRSLLADARAAAVAGDAPALGRAAHALKGMISNFCAAPAQDAALAVEKIGKSGDLAPSGAAIDTLHANLESLISDLQSFVRGGA